MRDSDPLAYAKERDEYNMQLQHDAVSNLVYETPAATPVRPHTLFSCVGAITQLPSVPHLHFLRPQDITTFMTAKGCHSFTTIKQATGIAVGQSVPPFLARLEGTPTVARLKR